jgi:hypothetical protein
VGAFENVKVELKRLLCLYGLLMYTQAQKNGNLTVSHYMTTLQKLTLIINKDSMIEYFKLPPNYNFKVDVKNTRLRNNQNDYNKYILQKNTDGDNKIVHYIHNITNQLVKGDIPNIFKYITDISGYDTILFDPNNLVAKDTTDNLFKFVIRDNDLQKQQQIKEMRNAAKQKRGGFSKEDVAKRIWQYQYLPPDPRSGFFERNTNEATKFREIKSVPEFTRYPFVEPGVDLGKKK